MSDALTENPQVPPAGGVRTLGYAPGRVGPRFNWPAVAACFCGLLLFVPFAPGLAALWLARRGAKVADEHPALPGRHLPAAARWLGRVNLIGWGTVVLAAPFWWVLVGREQANRAQCRSHLRTIGYAMQIYANENNGQLPLRLASLLQAFPTDIGPNIFVCPSSPDPPAAGATPAARRADVGAGRHVSYVYRFVEPKVSPMTGSLEFDELILVYEPPENHRGQGTHVLFPDGHVEWYDREQARQLRDDIATGRRLTQDPAGPPAWDYVPLASRAIMRRKNPPPGG